MKRERLPVLVVLAVALGACGGDGTPPSSGSSVPSFAGTYSSSQFWTLQVLRLSDGFMRSFTCAGSMTIVQSAGSGSSAPITGFATVTGTVCAPVSFNMSGRVNTDGSVSFTTGGPPPTEGPCPGGSNVAFAGLIATPNISARGVTTVQCPEFGEHQFTYIMAGRRP